MDEFDAGASAASDVAYRVSIALGPGQNLYTLSPVYAGLCGLADRGKIAVAFDGRSDGALTAAGLAAGLRARRTADGAVRLIGIDLDDLSDRFAAELLERCDVYFKRSFYRPHLAFCPAPARGKVQPYGLNYACGNASAAARVTRATGLQHFSWALAAGRRAPGRLREAYRVFKVLFSLPSVAEFERPPDVRADPVVVFQTRVWDQTEVYPDDADEVNESRVALVRALRAAFGTRFWGGLVPTPLAQSRYPREISPHPSRRRQYTALGKRGLVGVYTRGLNQSIAFKLAEYLAASQCVVAEPLRHELPEPLPGGRNLLTFSDAAGCVALCAALLGDAERATAMRQDNWQYYRSYVEPAAHLLRCLDRAFETFDSAPAPRLLESLPMLR